MSKGKTIGGLNPTTAADKLERMVIFDLCKKCEINKCFRCKQIIESYEDFSIDHMIPWRNEPDKQKAKEILEDENNLAISHKWCNTPDSERGCGELGYIGVTKNYGSIGSAKGYVRYPARVKKGNETLYFKYWKTPKQAALARDYLAYKIYDGQIVLNFEYLREFYKERVSKNDWSFINGDIEKLLGK